MRISNLSIISLILLVAVSGCTINLDMGNILDNAQTGLNNINQTMGQDNNGYNSENHNNELINDYLNNIINNFPGADGSELVMESSTGTKIIVKNNGSTPVNNLFILINEEWLNYELDEPILPGESKEIDFSARQAGEDLAIEIIYNNGKILDYISPASANTYDAGFSENPLPLNDIIYPNNTFINDTLTDLNDTFANNTVIDSNDTLTDLNDTFANNTIIDSNDTLTDLNNTFANNTVIDSNNTLTNNTSYNNTVIYSNDTSANTTVID